MPFPVALLALGAAGLLLLSQLSRKAGGTLTGSGGVSKYAVMCSDGAYRVRPEYHQAFMAALSLYDYTWDAEQASIALVLVGPGGNAARELGMLTRPPQYAVGSGTALSLTHAQLDYVFALASLGTIGAKIAVKKGSFPTSPADVLLYADLGADYTFTYGPKGSPTTSKGIPQVSVAPPKGKTGANVQVSPPQGKWDLDPNLPADLRARAIQLLEDDSQSRQTLELAGAQYAQLGYPRTAFALRKESTTRRMAGSTAPPPAQRGHSGTEIPPTRGGTGVVVTPTAAYGRPGATGAPPSARTGPQPWAIRSGDYPYLLAQRMAGDGGRWREILPLNPGMRVGANGQVSPWNVGQIVLLPESWDLSAAGTPLGGGKPKGGNAKASPPTSTSTTAAPPTPDEYASQSSSYGGQSTQPPDEYGGQSRGGEVAKGAPGGGGESPDEWIARKAAPWV